MFLVEILLPAKCDGEHEHIRSLLTEKFGGITAFIRAPAEGRWKNQGTVEHDEIVVLEIMTREIDSSWWKDFRSQLEEALGENEIVIRYHAIKRL